MYNKHGVIDPRFPHMISIEDFEGFVKERNCRTSQYIYILIDENGKRYVGQSTRSDFSRILEHFDRNSGKEIYEAYKSGIKFYVEAIIINWYVPFVLDEVERYYIEKYKAFENGYNKTHGNKNYKGLDDSEMS